MPDDTSQDKPDVKDAFREALERKKQQRHPHEEHRDGHGAGPASNNKVQRQFRRKSG